MSLRGKKAVWKRSLRKCAVALCRSQAAPIPFDQRVALALDELVRTAGRYYRLGRDAGIAEGRRRMRDER